MPSKDEQAKYFADHKVEEKLSEVIDQVATSMPANPFQFMAKSLSPGSGSGSAAAAAAVDRAAFGEAVDLPEGVCPCDLMGELVQMCKPISEGKHPPWYPPAAGEDLGLKVHNSLTSTLVPFIPAVGRRVIWYTCGPTVYDACHMGHARAYLTFDILRRIMEDYFHYEVMYQINITDVDDKIILRARRNKLLADFEAENLGEKLASYDDFKARVDMALTNKEASLAKKAAKLAEPLPAGAVSRDVEERATAIKQGALKTRQFAEIKNSVGFMHLLQTTGSSEKLLSVLKGGCAAQFSEFPALGAATSSLQLKAAIEAAMLDLNLALDPEIENPVQGKARDTLTAKVQGLSMFDAKVTALTRAEQHKDGTGAMRAMFATASGELGELLDDEKGASIVDHDVFNAHARKWEQAYMDDMEALNVKEPDVLTRVTEYVPRIVDFVDVIVKKGLAYSSNGSVYLSIDEFKKQGHHYRKLVPFAGDTSEADMEEGEGALAADATEKKNANDFALWKASKAGEPSWPSPWGDGRPGWHIECSVVAGDILGGNLDIHAGGVDLKFPHHDNELAQSEAYYGNHQWVNYFFHAGHLHIKGLKMSKSLKNFITIKQALTEHSPRQLRLMFLLQPWDRPMNYSDQTVDEARKKEGLFKVFFGRAKAELRTDWVNTTVGWRTAEDKKMYLKHQACQTAVHKAFCNNFDTPAVINALCDLIKEWNIYLEATTDRAVCLLTKSATYITQILRVLGVAEGMDDIGFPISGAGDDKRLELVLNALTSFRDEVRSQARSKAKHDVLVAACKAQESAGVGGAAAAVHVEDQAAEVLSAFTQTIMALASAGEPHFKILEACDQVRDDQLTAIGVRLEDGSTPEAGATWRLDDAETLKREVADKRAAEQAKKAAKAKTMVKKKVDELAKWTKAATPVVDLLKQLPEFSKYTFDAKGKATHDGAGVKLAKGAIKKVGKMEKKFSKDRAGYEKKLKADADFMSKLEAEIAQLQALL